MVAKPKSERILPAFSNSGNSPHGGDGCGVGVDAGPGIAEVVMVAVGETVVLLPPHLPSILERLMKGEGCSRVTVSPTAR